MEDSLTIWQLVMELYLLTGAILYLVYLIKDGNNPPSRAMSLITLLAIPLFWLPMFIYKLISFLKRDKKRDEKNNEKD